MAFNRFAVGIALRTCNLALVLCALVWVLTNKHWPMCALLLFCGAGLAFYALVRFANAAGRLMAEFLDALTFDDATRTLSQAERNGPRSLVAAIDRAMARLRLGRAEREEQSRYLQTLLAHTPVALMTADADGTLQLLNPAARRLFETRIETLGDCMRYGEDFVAGLTPLKAGESALVPMERPSGRLYLKVDATAVIMQRGKRMIYSLQNIAGELNAQELASWQTVIRTMTHEVMNSLTPVSSLAATAGDIVRAVRDESEGETRRQLDDAVDALQIVTRRAEGLSAFVQNHRRLTHRLTVQPERLNVQRVFARLHRLLSADIAERGIAFVATVEPATLEITADADLIDQALINLIRNAMDAVRERPGARITLSARRDGDGRAVLCVADNGPGIAPEERQKIFVPFYTTKRHGTGIGLTLVRQIAAAHGAEISVGPAPDGGASFKLRF